MKSGSIVMAKVTNNLQKWMEESDKKQLRNCCVWFDNYRDIHKMIASVVRAWITDNVPTQISKAVKETLKLYSYDNTKNEMVNYIKNIIDIRKKEMESLIIQIKAQE